MCSAETRIDYCQSVLRDVLLERMIRGRMVLSTKTDCSQLLFFINLTSLRILFVCAEYLPLSLYQVTWRRVYSDSGVCCCTESLGVACAFWRVSLTYCRVTRCVYIVLMCIYTVLTCYRCTETVLELMYIIYRSDVQQQASPMLKCWLDLDQLSSSTEGTPVIRKKRRQWNWKCILHTYIIDTCKSKMACSKYLLARSSWHILS